MADEKPTHGTFCWNELMTRDVTAAEKFYTELIGWKAVDSGMPGIAMPARHCGLFHTMPPGEGKDSFA